MSVNINKLNSVKSSYKNNLGHKSRLKNKLVKTVISIYKSRLKWIIQTKLAQEDSKKLAIYLTSTKKNVLNIIDQTDSKNEFSFIKNVRENFNKSIDIYIYESLNKSIKSEISFFIQHLKFSLYEIEKEIIKTDSTQRDKYQILFHFDSKIHTHLIINNLNSATYHYLVDFITFHSAVHFEYDLIFEMIKITVDAEKHLNKIENHYAIHRLLPFLIKAIEDEFDFLKVCFFLIQAANSNKLKINDSLFFNLAQNEIVNDLAQKYVMFELVNCKKGSFAEDLKVLCAEIINNPVQPKSLEELTFLKLISYV